MSAELFIDLSNTDFGGDVDASIKGMFKKQDQLNILTIAQKEGFLKESPTDD